MPSGQINSPRPDEHNSTLSQLNKESQSDAGIFMKNMLCFREVWGFLRFCGTATAHPSGINKPKITITMGRVVPQYR